MAATSSLISTAGASSYSATTDAASFKESDSLLLEWRITNLKALFEGSKGETKSRVVKSAYFGGGRWQILFYPNAGGSASEYTSLYLSCEPAWDEYEDQTLGGSPRWKRQGTYGFKFVILADDGNKTICTKEASNHTFASKTANWGWASFSKRDVVYFHNAQTIRSDSLTISCVITSASTAPRPPPTSPQQSVPRDLLHRVGSLLDNPSYSDVEFVITKGTTPRSIFANKTMLSRADYFETMLSSGFSEGVSEPVAGGGPALCLDDDLNSAFVHDFAPAFEDSDDDESSHSDISDDHSSASRTSSRRSSHVRPADTDSPSQSPYVTSSQSLASVLAPTGGEDAEEEETDENDEGLSSSADLAPRGGETETAHHGDVVRFSNQIETTNGGLRAETNQTKDSFTRDGEALPGPKKSRVVVRDAAYSTFHAILTYLYTDQIAFAPLTSSFVSAQSSTGSLTQPHSPSARNLSSHSRTASTVSASALLNQTHLPAPQARKAWLKAWSDAHPGRPMLPSAKSVYVLADKMGLIDLKQRAFLYIVANLTTANISYEVFSAFTASFDEVRKVEIEFFLKNWAIIKHDDGMKNVWSELRSGQHRGFEQIWPLILSNLHYKSDAQESPET